MASDADPCPADSERNRQLLAEIARYRMPFGKFGPKAYPPEGVPIYDLPPEYLAWFAQKGWPSGKLGQLLQIVHEIKAAGADEVFAEIRSRNGGRTKLFERKRRKEFEFGE